MTGLGGKRGRLVVVLVVGGVSGLLALKTRVAVNQPAAANKIERSESGSGRGVVRLDGRALADEGGSFNALGATLFWALWGERHDPDRLDANLGWLAGFGVDFVRVLGMVGSSSWSDRVIDPEEPDYWAVVDRLLGRLKRHGLRAEITIFADAQVMMSDPVARRHFVEAWADRVNRDAERFVFVEISNEHWKNGLDDIGELRDLGRRFADRTNVLLALSSPASGEACSVYAASAADLATVHYPRVASSGGWAALLEPWEWPAAYDGECTGALPPAVNNEPVGPGSTVHAESDPLPLVMAYVMTFVSQNAAYVLHAGPGVRGGGAADLAMGRAANLYDTPGLDAAFEGIQAAQRYLPRGLANWDRHAPSDLSHPFAGFDHEIARGRISAAYAASSGERFVVAVVGLRESVTVSPRRACSVEVRDARTGAVTGVVRLAAGDVLVLEGAPALVLTGVCAETAA